jgi:Hydroxymethylglutaryl-coenzyme A synthase N terminal
LIKFSIKKSLHENTASHLPALLVEEFHPSKMSSKPQNIGIKAIEIYFPNQVSFGTAQGARLNNGHKLTCYQCVDQTELEVFDGAAAGKYTIGLGQTKMAFCDDREGQHVRRPASIPY